MTPEAVAVNFVLDCKRENITSVSNLVLQGKKGTLDGSNRVVEEALNRKVRSALKVRE